MGLSYKSLVVAGSLMLLAAIWYVSESGKLGSSTARGEFGAVEDSTFVGDERASLREPRLRRRQLASSPTGVEGREYPEIDREEVERMIESEEVVGMEFRAPSGDLIDASEPLALALKLSEDEVSAMNKVWERIRPKLNALRAEHIKSQTMADGEVWIGVEVFADDGDILRQAFMGEVHALLGEDRGALLLQGVRAHRAYGRWGRTVGSGFSIKVREQDDGSYLYEIAEQVQTYGVGRKIWKTDRVPAHLQPLAVAAGIELTP